MLKKRSPRDWAPFFVGTFLSVLVTFLFGTVGVNKLSIHNETALKSISLTIRVLTIAYIKMKIDDLITYQEVINKLNKRPAPKHLLFGNGFSMAYDRDIFSYNALSRFIENTSDPLIKNLFEKLNTKNFELIMQQLDNFCEIALIFSDDKTLVPKIKRASEKLKNSLLMP